MKPLARSEQTPQGEVITVPVSRSDVANEKTAWIEETACDVPSPESITAWRDEQYLEHGLAHRENGLAHLATAKSYFS